MEVYMAHTGAKQSNQIFPKKKSKQRIKALERVWAYRQSILEERTDQPFETDVVDLIHQMREERDQELLKAIQNPPK
jgi:hypothetical protein